jgi:hypothetical protein
VPSAQADLGSDQGSLKIGHVVGASARPVPPWLSGYCANPVRVEEFASEHKVLDDLKAAVDLVAKHFPAHDKIEIDIKADQEEERIYLVVKVTIHQDVVGFIQAYKRCMADWTAGLTVHGLEYISFGHNVL